LPRKLIILLLLAAAAAVRLGGINCQLWLDEIWSIRWMQTCRSPLDVFTLLHHDNNHWLNTLWLYCLGAGQPWWAYHVLAEATGIGTVVLGWMIARRRGAWQGIAALILLGASEFLIEFSSEARGYAPVGFFALASVWLFEEHLARPRRWKVAAMVTSALLGILSHLTFLVVLAGLVVASAKSVTRRRSWPMDLARLGLWWAVPVALLLVLYVVDVRHMEVGGGPTTPADLPSEAAAMILGVPLGSMAAPICGVIAMAICAVQIGRLYRAADPTWPVYLAGWVLAPVVLFCLPRTEYLHPRYLYVAVPLLMIAMGIELGRWINSPVARWPAAAILLAFVLVNAREIRTFLILGRGDYLGATSYIVANTAAPRILVASTLHPISIDMVVQYYEQYHLKDRRPVDGNAWPQWMVSETDNGPAMSFPEARRTYLLKAVFSKGTVTSGVPWFVYEDSTIR